jgi:hypothetical protein
VTRAGRALVYGAGLLWIAAALGGTAWIFLYESRPTAAGQVAQAWPDALGLARNENGYSLVIAVHPKCSCTRASVAELNELMLAWGGQVHATALVTRPFEVADLWSETDVTARLREIPHVTVVRDPGGAKSAAFGARSSGQTLLYDASGALSFAGGITAFRGHEGPSLGSETLKQIVAGEVARGRPTKVFGCSLENEVCPLRGGPHEGHDHGDDDERV